VAHDQDVPAETRDIVEAALDARSAAALELPISALPDVPDRQGPMPGTIQLRPHRHRTDAMFIALIRRSEEFE
jgi:16S rRNA (cytosine967-C5)-methyltransferase